jgi:ketosteroid isomerase-like protein
MSQENVEIVRGMYEAFNRGDVASAMGSLHPDAELHQPPEAPDADSYYGRDEWARGFGLWLSAFDEPRFEPQETTEVGDWVIMRVLVAGRGKSSGVESTAEFFHAWSLLDGNLIDAWSARPEPRPSKLPGWSSRPCRRRTWRRVAAQSRSGSCCGCRPRLSRCAPVCAPVGL